MPAAVAAPLIGGGLTAGAGLIGSGKQAAQQQQASNAASQAFGAEENMIQQLLGNYMQQAPAFLQGAQGLQGQLATLGQDASALPAQFQSASNQEIGALGTQEAQQGQSLINTLRSQLGGVANPGLSLSRLGGTFADSVLQGNQGMESQLAGQDLGALTDALNTRLGALGQSGGILSNIGQFIEAPVSAGLSGLGNIGQTYAGAAASQGNPWSSGLGALGNFFTQNPSLFGGTPGNSPTFNFTGAFPPIPTTPPPDYSWLPNNATSLGPLATNATSGGSVYNPTSGNLRGPF